MDFQKIEENSQSPSTIIYNRTKIKMKIKIEDFYITCFWKREI